MPKGTQLAYIAGPYTATNTIQRDINVVHAEEVGMTLMHLDYTPIIPHKNFYAMEQRENELSYNHSDWLRHCLILMLRCDVVIFMNNWEKSKGASVEHTVAEAMGMRIIYEDEDGNLRMDKDGDEE